MTVATSAQTDTIRTPAPGVYHVPSFSNPDKSYMVRVYDPEATDTSCECLSSKFYPLLQCKHVVEVLAYRARYSDTSTARTFFESDQVIRVGSGEYLVPSFSDPDIEYRVAVLPNGDYSCECAHSFYRGSHCKHMKAVTEYRDLAEDHSQLENTPKAKAKSKDVDPLSAYQDAQEFTLKALQQLAEANNALKTAQENERRAAQTYLDSLVVDPR